MKKRDRETHRPGGKSSSVAVSNKFERKLMVVLVSLGLLPYEVPAKDETITAVVHYLELLKRLMDR